MEVGQGTLTGGVRLEWAGGRQFQVQMEAGIRSCFGYKVRELRRSGLVGWINDDSHETMVPSAVRMKLAIDEGTGQRGT